MKYEIHTWSLCDGWANNSTDCSLDSEEPLQFDTYEEAKAEVEDMVRYFDFIEDEIKIVKL